MIRLSPFLAFILLAAPQEPLRVDVDLVNVYATVQDEGGRYVSGLGRDDFRILEDGVERPIEVFEASADLASSLGVLIDTSGGSADFLPSVRMGVLDFVGTLGPEDEFFLMTFATQPRIIHRFGQDSGGLARVVNALRAWGATVFYDALRDGTAEVGRGEHERKALVVLSDGYDNGSTTLYRDVVQAARRSMVLLYFVGMGRPILVDTHTLEGLASMTGGRVVMRSRGQPVSEALRDIREDLHHQYYLAYRGSSEKGYHSIRIELPGRSFPVRARDGYLVE